MLTSLVTFALAVCACAAQSYDPEVQYIVVPRPASRNLLREAAELRSQVFALGQSDLMINNRLDSLMSKIDDATAFREEFESTLNNQIESSMQAQDDRIRAIRDQIIAQRTLLSDVEALRVKVDNLISELIELRATRRNVLDDIQALEDADDVADQQISDIEAQVDQQDARLADADYEVGTNEYKAEEVYGNLLKVVDIINQENGISFDVVLTQENPIVNFTFDNPFPTVPGAHWGIVGYNVEDLPAPQPPQSYGSYGPPPSPEEVINNRVEVDVDRYGGGAALIDESEGFRVISVRIRVSIFSISNAIIEYTPGQVYAS